MSLRVASSSALRMKIPSSTKADTLTIPSRKLMQLNRASSSSSSSSSASSSQSTTLPQSVSPSLLISHIDPNSLYGPLTPSSKSKTLYEHLAALPNNGIGTRVRQIKWAARGIDIPWGQNLKGPIVDALQRKEADHLCYWEITKARMKWIGEKQTPHGKVWGRLVWRGAHITGSDKEERIRGGLKHSWDAAR